MTTDATGHLAGSSFGSESITSLTNSVAGLQAQINQNLTEARAGTALACATGNLHYDPRPGKLSVALGFGNYKGVSGLAGGIGWAATDRFRFSVATSAALSTNGYGFAVSHVATRHRQGPHPTLAAQGPLRASA